MTPATKAVHEQLSGVSKYRDAAAFGLAGIALLLRMASDWQFSQGGPLWYQGVQAALLVIAVLLLWPSIDQVFLKGGDDKASIKEGLIAVPLGIVFGLLGAFALYHGLTLPSTDQALTVIGNNLFFPAVEELEFRGFMLAWLLSKNVSPGKAIVITAVIHVLAHPTGPGAGSITCWSSASPCSCGTAVSWCGPAASGAPTSPMHRSTSSASCRRPATT